MINSGSKGKPTNIAQIVACLFCDILTELFRPLHVQERASRAQKSFASSGPVSLSPPVRTSFVNVANVVFQNISRAGKRCPACRLCIMCALFSPLFTVDCTPLLAYLIPIDARNRTRMPSLASCSSAPACSRCKAAYGAQGVNACIVRGPKSCHAADGARC